MADPIRRLKETSAMTIHTPTQRAGFTRLPILAVASASLVFGFAVGQVTPNLIGSIGAALDSPRTQVVAPALTRADDYSTRHAAAAPALTAADDYGTRHSAVAPALTAADDYGTRHSAVAPALTAADDYGTRHSAP
jgi:hypothetical protein